MRTITKKDLVNSITEALTKQEALGDAHLSDEARATRVKVTKCIVKDVIQHFLDSITQELAAGNRLEFREFGVFEVKKRAARRAQNPQTLEKVDVPAKRVVKFKVGRRMRELVEVSELETKARQPGPAASKGSGEAELGA